MIEVIPVGGYSEVGKNMTALKIDDEILILDMGLYLPAVLSYEEGDPHDLSTQDLIKIGAIPNDDLLKKEKEKVKAIILGHCHLDHIGAVPYLGFHYNCPIIGTPYTLEVLKNILEEHHSSLKKRFKQLDYNSSFKISENISIEFVPITHSTIQTALVIIHTKYGDIIYANDFKLDNHPVLGQKPNYDRLEKLSENCLLLIMDSLYSNLEAKTPSEKVAKEMLKDVLVGVRNEDNAIIVTTFSSHIARLKSIVEFSRNLDRKVVFLGRSLYNYVSAAEKLNLINFGKEVELVGFRREVNKKLLDIQKQGRNKYVIVCTGNQGEPESVLSRIANKDLQFELFPNDIVIFSCRTIPTEMTIKNREVLEKKLKQKHVRIFTNIHVSVLPDTQVVVNDDKTMKIKEIQEIKEDKKIKVPAFDKNAKIKWYDARLVKHNYSGKIFNIETKSGRNVT